jgi:hypothetical protein
VNSKALKHWWIIFGASIPLVILVDGFTAPFFSYVPCSKYGSSTCEVPQQTNIIGLALYWTHVASLIWPDVALVGFVVLSVALIVLHLRKKREKATIENER